MNVTRIGPAGEVQPVPATAAVRPVGPGGAEAPPPAPAGPRPVDVAAALRILYDEVRAALAAQGNELLDPMLARLPAAVDGPERGDLGRLFARLLQAAAPVATADGRSSWQVLLAALDEGHARALAHVQRGAAAPAAVTAGLEQAHAGLVRALETAAHDAKSPSPQSARAFERVLAGFAAALEDRVGSLPPAVLPDYDGGEPAVAVQALARALRYVAADPAFASRATPSVLSAAVEDGARRASAALAGAGGATPAAHDLVEDLRVILTRALPAAEPPDPPAAGATPPAGTQSRAESPLSAPVRALAAELARAVATATGAAPPVVAPAGDVADPASGAAIVLLGATRLLAPLPAGDPRLARAFLAGELEVAIRRTALQLPPGGTFDAGPRALLAEVGAVAARLLAAAESAAAQWPGEARAFLRLTSEAALALLRGHELPFRLDLAPWRGAATARRRGTRSGGIDGIDSSDPRDDPTAGDGDAVGAELARLAKER